ncbi:MAG: SsrA-binding protein SmpB [Chloroflexota bacterium]
MKSLTAEQERKVRPIASNRRARHDYEIVSTLEAGIALQGTEVKSLRAGKCSMQDSYASFVGKNDRRLFVHNLHIEEYDHGNRENHKPKRERALLINATEARKLYNQVTEKGVTLIPLSLYFSGHLVKVELGLARAKRKYDKRESIKERDVERDVRRKFRV